MLVVGTDGMGPICCAETSVSDNQHMLRNNSEEQGTSICLIVERVPCLAVNPKIHYTVLESGPIVGQFTSS